MKTSNKILLIFFLSVMGIFGVVHLALYAKFRQGKIITDPVVDEDWCVRYRGKAPSVFTVEGNVNVNIVPSDSFFIEYGIHVDDILLSHRGGNDSFAIREEHRVTVDPHGSYQDYSDFPWVKVHAGHCSRFRFRGVMVLLYGWQAPGPRSWGIEAINSQIQAGGDVGTGTIVPETFDSLHIDATNSNIVLRRNAVIGQLGAQLDPNSAINDLGARVGKTEIHYGDRSRINLTGVNLDKLREKQ